jgi:hypothetical protein
MRPLVIMMLILDFMPIMLSLAMLFSQLLFLLLPSSLTTVLLVALALGGIRFILNRLQRLFYIPLVRQSLRLGSNAVHSWHGSVVSAVASIWSGAHDALADAGEHTLKLRSKPLILW